MFESDRFIAECRSASAAQGSAGVLDLVARAVSTPADVMTGAIHVYGGDFFGVSRSEWDPEQLVEHPYDVEKTLALFEESNRLFPPRD